MTKKELVARMQQCVGDKTGMISLFEFAEFIGLHPNNARAYLKGLEYVGRGKKKYLIDDIAGRLLERSEVK